MESTDALGVLRDPKPQRSKSGRRIRYVDLESPRPPNSRSKSPLTIQIEDVEGSAMLVSPTAKSRKKKGRRSTKRKQLDNARAHAHNDRDQTPLRTKSTSGNKTSPKKKLRVRVDAEQKPTGVRAPSPIILAATPSGDDVLMLKGHALDKQDSGDNFVLTPTRDVLLRRGDHDITESKQRYIRHAITAPLPKLYKNDAPPPHTQTLQLSSISKIPPRLQNRALAPLSESKTQLKSKAKTKRRSKLRDKFASAKAMGAQIEEMTATQNNQPAAFVPSMPSMPTMPGRSPNNRVSTIRQKFVAAKALGMLATRVAVSARYAKKLRMIVGSVMNERLTSGWVRFRCT